jgi:hypothetical protein
LKKTDIGITAVKMFDSAEPEDDELSRDICALAVLYVEFRIMGLSGVIVEAAVRLSSRRFHVSN